MQFAMEFPGLTRVKLLGVIAVLSLLTLAGASGALATTATGNQNPDLVVVASLTSNNVNSDTATDGDVVTAFESIENTTTKRQSVAVTNVLEAPGEVYYTITRRVVLDPLQTLTLTLTYTVDASFPRGFYNLTVSASNRNGGSSATASIELY